MREKYSLTSPGNVQDCGLPDAIEFRAGDVWQTTRGALYKVLEVRRGGQAILRAGEEGTGRIVYKRWDDVGWWGRVSCGLKEVTLSGTIAYPANHDIHLAGTDAAHEANTEANGNENHQYPTSRGL